MKKIKLLQLLVYIAFGLLIVHNVLPSAARGFNDGWRDGTNQVRGKTATPQLIPADIDGRFLTSADGVLQTGHGYTLQNISLHADVGIPGNLPANTLLTLFYVVIILGITVLLIFVAISINQIIVRIVRGEMFTDRCIGYLRKTGLLLLAYAIADVIYQRLCIAELRNAIHAPLQIINTTTFNFQLLICALLTFIIAEAFKYGARLQAEQDLTI